MADNDNEAATAIRLVRVPLSAIFALNADLVSVRLRIVNAKRRGQPAATVDNLRRLEGRLIDMLGKMRRSEAASVV